MPANDEKTFLSGQAIGHYQIIEQIGAGGMGTVYRARDLKLDREVAIKFISSKFEHNESGIERFMQEAKAASALNHPNILTIHEIGEHDGSHYVVSEYIAGKTLRQVINEGVLDLTKKISVFVQIAAGLQAAHAARIIHRDIKPENVVLRSDGYAKILDFGLAKLLPTQPSFIGLDDTTLPRDQTVSGLILGTVSYMSPEQARGESVDARSDIFSLGILIYETVTGMTPFAGNTMADKFANLLKKDPIAMSSLVSGVPEELESVVEKCLRKDPIERYQTAKELLRDLSALRSIELSGNGAPPVSTLLTERETEVLPRSDLTNAVTSSTRIWYRRPVSVAGIALLLLAIAGVAWYWRRSATLTQPPIKSLAVLPLKSLDSGENYLGLGIADTVIRKISQTGQVTVRPTSAIRRYLTEETDAVAAAKQLNADAVLEGNVQRADDRLRVSVNLLRTSDGSSIWSDSFDMRSGDIFAIQDSVAQQVASRLRLRLDADQNARLNKHATANAVAYDYYLRGVYSLDQRTWGPKAKPQAESTAELFKNAITADPEFALAHAQLANVYAWIGTLIEPQNSLWFDHAQEEISRADNLDPNLAETHLARMTVLTGSRSGYQWEAGIREGLAAQHIDPNVGHANLADAYYHIGLEEQSEREFNKALEIDPTSQFNQNEYVLFLLNYRRYNEMASLEKKYFPDDPLFSDYFVGNGQIDEAAKLIEQETKDYPDNPWSFGLKAIVLEKKGDHAGAEAAIRDAIKLLRPLELSYHHMTYQIACAYAVMGKKDEAMKWLRETAATGYPVYPVFARDAFLDPIRKEPEFIQFMTEMKSLNEKYTNEFQ